MKVLMNQYYFIVLPKAPKTATEELARLYKIAHKELKSARIVSKTVKWVHIGVLTRRTI